VAQVGSRWGGGGIARGEAARPDTKLGPGLAPRGRLPVDQHHVVDDAHLVGVNVGGDRYLGQLARMGRVTDVDDGRAVRRLHVRDVSRGPAHHDLPAAGAIEISDRSKTARVRHGALGRQAQAIAYTSFTPAGSGDSLQVRPPSSVPKTCPKRLTQYTWSWSRGCRATPIMVLLALTPWSNRVQV